jgi:hypothetical protein
VVIFTPLPLYSRKSVPGINPHFLALGTNFEMNGQLHAPAALLPGRLLSVTFGYEAECVRESVWIMYRGENFLFYRDSNSGPSVV